MTITNERTGEKITASRSVIQDLKLTFTCEMNDAINHERWATASWVDACETALQDYADTASWCEYVNSREQEIKGIIKDRENETEIEMMVDKYACNVVTNAKLSEIEGSEVVEKVVATSSDSEFTSYNVLFINGGSMVVDTPKQGTKEWHRATLKELDNERVTKAVEEKIMKHPLVVSVRPITMSKKEITLDDGTKFMIKVI